MATHEQLVQLLRKYYLKIKGYGEFFYVGSIPIKKLNMALTTFVPSDIDQTTIVGFYDVSEVHNCTYGYLFTDDRVYYVNDRGLTNNIVYSDIERVEFNRGNNWIDHYKLHSGTKSSSSTMLFKLYDGSTVYWNHFSGNPGEMYNFWVELLDLIHSDDDKEVTKINGTIVSSTDEVDVEDSQPDNSINSEQDLQVIQKEDYTEEATDENRGRTKNETIKDTSLFKKLNFDVDQVYPMIVVATVSSGKSTLINALVGKELLPSKGSACTARATAILDNDSLPLFRIHAVDNAGEYHLIEMAASQTVKNYNENNDISEMIIEGDISGIRNSKKALLIVDTPGTNNSVDLTHGVVTQNVLDEFTEGLILYVIDGHNPGTDQDDQLLKQVAEKVTKNPDFHIIFAVNKMDLIDPEHEDVGEYMSNCREYVRKHGFEDPTLVPVSSKCALAFKKAINGETLSPFENSHFDSDFENFRREGFSLEDYALISGQSERYEIIEINGQQYTMAGIMDALENTGIPILEREIDKALVDRVKMSAPEINLKSEPKIELESKGFKEAMEGFQNVLNNILKKENE